MIIPDKPHPELAKSQFREDLKKIPIDYVEHYQWNFEPNFDDLRLCVDMWSFDKNHNMPDDYHIVMDMSYYRKWPPGVTFVNPETQIFDPARDMKWMPRMNAAPNGVGIGYHASYTLATTKKTKQMICNSMILEYYQSNHAPKPEEMWDSNKYTMFATINLLQEMLTEPYYGGRSG